MVRIDVSRGLLEALRVEERDGKSSAVESEIQARTAEAASG